MAARRDETLPGIGWAVRRKRMQAASAGGQLQGAHEPASLRRTLEVGQGDFQAGHRRQLQMVVQPLAKAAGLLVVPLQPGLQRRQALVVLRGTRGAGQAKAQSRLEDQS